MRKRGVPPPDRSTRTLSAVVAAGFGLLFSLDQFRRRSVDRAGFMDLDEALKTLNETERVDRKSVV